MKVNILIPNVGRRGYIVKYLKEIQDFTGKVFVSDCDPTASGLYGNNDGSFILPKPIENPERYIQELLELCLEKNIRIIIPVIDPEIFLLSKHKEKFAQNGIFVVVSDEMVLETCYNKVLMNGFLQENHFMFPLTFQSLETFKTALEERSVSFPVILKPVWGSGSEATYRTDTWDKTEALFSDGMIIQEYIDGTEYGVDLFNSLKKEPVRCVVKKKISMRSGETDKAVTVRNDDISRYMVELGKIIGHIGNLDCDVIVKGNDIYVIDLNPRFGGGYPATHASGVNLLSLVLNLYENIDIKPEFNDYEENLLVMKEVNVVAVRSSEMKSI